MDILITKNKLESVLGQLIDVKEGRLGELVLRKDEWTDLLTDCVLDKIEQLKTLLEYGEQEPY
jgi:hypothetical protein